MSYNPLLFKAQSASQFLGGPASGSAVATFRSILIGDLPSLNYASRALDNLTSPTAINQDLLFGTDGANQIGGNAGNRPGLIYALNNILAGTSAFGTYNAIFGGPFSGYILSGAVTDPSATNRLAAVMGADDAATSGGFIGFFYDSAPSDSIGFSTPTQSSDPDFQSLIFGGLNNESVKLLRLGKDGTLSFLSPSGADLFWATDGAGNVGSSTNGGRPNSVFAVNQVVAGGGYGDSALGTIIGQPFSNHFTGALFNNGTYPLYQLGVNDNPDQSDLLQLIDSFNGQGVFLQFRGGALDSSGITELRLTASSPVFGQIDVPGAPTNFVWDLDGSGDIGRGLGRATAVLQDVTFYAVLEGADRNGWTIQYVAGATAGSEFVSVAGTTLSIHIASGVTTANTVQGLLGGAGAVVPGWQFVGVITGTGSNTQTAPASAVSAGGSTTAMLRPNEIFAKSAVHVGDNGALSITQGAVSTSGTTPANVQVVPTVTNSTIFLKTRVVGRRSSGSPAGDSIVTELTAVIKNIAGSVTILDVQTDYSYNDNPGTWNTILNVSGTNVQIRVNGGTGDSIAWVSATETQKV